MAAYRVSRRSLLIGGGAGLGLIVGWTLWPRAERIRLNTMPGEHVLGGFVKVGTDGHVVIVVPQVELGHGVFTTLAQIVADELGADWRTVGVETAVPGPIYANTLFAREWNAGLGHSILPGRLGDPFSPIAVTGRSTSIRAFEERLRDAGAAAQALICKAAAARWDADWRACETANGFVMRGDDKMRFGDVAAEASQFDLPETGGRRTGTANRLTGVSLPRLDLPSKVDGSVNFAADVRLPDMVFASIAEGPIGDTTIVKADRDRAMQVAGVIDVVATENWVAVVASNWWAANKGLEAMRTRFSTKPPFADDHTVDQALDAAFAEGTRINEAGDIGAMFRGATVMTQSYRIGFAPHAAIETASATAMIENGRLQVWLATQVPSAPRRAAAKAIGYAESAVTIHPMMVGGSFGARFESEIAGRAAILAERMKRPVQLTRSRAEETRRDRFRPPSAARMAARVGAGGRIDAWFAQIAAPATAHEMQKRVFEGASPHDALTATARTAEPAAVDGAWPPYGIPTIAIDHHPAAIGVPTGEWRGRAHVANAFFRECFIDELAHMTGNEPFSYRMGMLGENPRLAQCLSMVAAHGGWQGGGQGTNQGLACHSMADSHIAVFAEARLDGARIRVDKLIAVVDCGRVINPDVVRAQIIGGLIFGMASATGAPIRIARSLPEPIRLGELLLPRMADLPDVKVELVQSASPPGGVGEIAVPPVGPAIANALFASTGARFRRLPLKPVA